MADKKRDWYPPKGDGKGGKPEPTHARHARERHETHARHASERDDMHKRHQKDHDALAQRHLDETAVESGLTQAGPQNPPLSPPVAGAAGPGGPVTAPAA
jgi:hypothetical protein